MNEHAFFVVFIVLLYGFFAWCVPPGGSMRPKRPDETLMEYRRVCWANYRAQMRQWWSERPRWNDED